MSMRKPALLALLVIGAAAFAAQLVTVERVNPSASPGSPLAAPAEIDALLTRACRDCHSNRTRWPWYSRVAPASWIVARDVALGRAELNFSEWGAYYPQTRLRKLQWMGRMVREGSMPPWTYRAIHPGARLTKAERALLDRWIEAEIFKLAPHVTPDQRPGSVAK